MYKINFVVYFCGMADGLFSEKIMLWPAIDSYKRTYVCGVDMPVEATIGDALARFKIDYSTDHESGSDWENEHFRLNHVYIELENVLLALQEDKRLSNIFSYFDRNEIRLALIISGGASLHCNGYKFIVHPNEDIHKNTPHVHVVRNEEQTRYNLNTLSRFPSDKFSRAFKRDEKKIIIPYLKKNQGRLLDYWNLYMNGYIPPVEDENGMQYYNES